MEAWIFEIITTDSFSLSSINIVRKLKMSNFNCMMISSAGKLLMDTILFCLKLQDIALHHSIGRLYTIQMQLLSNLRLDCKNEIHCRLLLGIDVSLHNGSRGSTIDALNIINIRYTSVQLHNSYHHCTVSLHLHFLVLLC